MLRVQLLLACIGYTPPGTTRTRSQGSMKTQGSLFPVIRNMGRIDQRKHGNDQLSRFAAMRAHTNISEHFPRNPYTPLGRVSFARAITDDRAHTQPPGVRLSARCHAFPAHGAISTDRAFPWRRYHLALSVSPSVCFAYVSSAQCPHVCVCVRVCVRRLMLRFFSKNSHYPTTVQI